MLSFLIDTGSDVSVIAIKNAKRYLSSFPGHHHQHPQHYQDWLYAANGTLIWTYGQTQLNLNLGLRRAFAFNFHIADTQNNIIGADFLAQYHFCPDLQARRLLDADTLLSRPLKLRNCNQPSLSAINSSLDGRVQELLKLKATTTAADSPVEHHILTTEGLPIFCRPRRFIGGKNGKRVFTSFGLSFSKL